MDDNEIIENLAQFVSAADRLTPMAQYLAEPIIAFYKALIAGDVDETAAAYLAGLWLTHLLGTSTSESVAA